MWSFLYKIRSPGEFLFKFPHNPHQFKFNAIKNLCNRLNIVLLCLRKECMRTDSSKPYCQLEFWINNSASKYIYRMSRKSGAWQTSVIRQHMENCKEGIVVANRVSGLRCIIFYLWRAVTVIQYSLYKSAVEGYSNVPNVTCWQKGL
jgi:hypothetical protein